MRVDAEHSTKHGDADLKADARKESDENGARKEIRKKAELQQPGDQQKCCGENSDSRGKSDVAGAANCGHGSNPAGENGSSGGICGNNQVAGTSKNSEGEKWQQQGVETGDDRRAGYLCVAERLWNIHGGQLNARQRVFDARQNE